MSKLDNSRMQYEYTTWIDTFIVGLNLLTSFLFHIVIKCYKGFLVTLVLNIMFASKLWLSGLTLKGVSDLILLSLDLS